MGSSVTQRFRLVLSQWRLVTELSTVQERFGDRGIKAKSVSHTVFMRWITVVSCYSGNCALAVLCCGECHSERTSYSNLSHGHVHPTNVFVSLLIPNKNRVSCNNNNNLVLLTLQVKALLFFETSELPTQPHSVTSHKTWKLQQHCCENIILHRCFVACQRYSL